VFQDFLSLLNVSTVEEARSLTSDTLIAANVQQIENAPYGTYPYGPTVDHSFVPGLPSELLVQGLFDKNVRVLVGHNADEGLYFVDPRVANETAFQNYVRKYMPLIQDSVLNYITDELYPPIYNGSQPYIGFLARISLFTSEALLSCNAHYLTRALSNNAYAYQFSVLPGTMGRISLTLSITALRQVSTAWQ